MTYHAGIHGFGQADCEPHVTCNGCDARVSCLRSSGMPYAWARDGKAPPGWKLVRVEDPFSRKDWCKACKRHMVPADLNLVRITGLYLGGAPNGFDTEHQRLDGDWQKYFVRKGWRIERCPVAHPFSTGCSTCDPYHGAIAVKVST
jgi:hypothetical protein